MQIRKHVWTLCLIFSISFPTFAQVDYCKFREWGDCTDQRAIKLNAKHLDDFLDVYPDFEEKELTHLFIYGNLDKSLDAEKLTKIPLRTLVMRKARLEKVPRWVFDISTLETLDLGDNYILELPSALCNLMELKELYLWVNDLHNLPFCLNEMENLRRVDMTGIKLNQNDQDNLSKSFRAVNFLFSEPCNCNFQEEE